jgi:hypothetical protein
MTAEQEQELNAALAAARAKTIEEIAVFAETHYCLMDENEPSGYKVYERKKHPNEPFARAIRALV